MRLLSDNPMVDLALLGILAAAICAYLLVRSRLSR
jgi:hypothetical protein